METERKRLKMEDLMQLHECYPGIIQYLAENRRKTASEIIWAVTEGLFFVEDVAEEVLRFMDEFISESLESMNKSQLLQIAEHLLPPNQSPQPANDNPDEPNQS